MLGYIALPEVVALDGSQPAARVPHPAFRPQPPCGGPWESEERQSLPLAGRKPTTLLRRLGTDSNRHADRATRAL